MTRTMPLGAVAALLCAAAAQGQQPGRPTCDAAEHRQFDFWVGEWEVRDTAGAVVGSNRISRILDGCVLLEEWTGATGSVGRSFNIYDRTTGKWYQTWVDNGGLRLELSGGLEGEDLVLTGSTLGRNGSVLHRLAFEPRDGTVRQHWQQSGDGGSTWTTVFDGVYVRTRE